MNYVYKFSQKCKYPYIINCPTDIMRQMKIEDEVKTCFNDSFEFGDDTKNIYLSDNVLLRQEREYYQSKKVP